MTKRHVIIYMLLAALCAIAYPMGRSIIVRQEPFGHLIVSNLTLNYVLLFVLAGAISPWVASKMSFLRKFKKSTASGIVMLVIVSVLLITLTLVGLPMRWS